jgi:glycosyltransferase involved in cell wall biosynthesis
MRIVSLLAQTRCGIYQFHCNLSRGLAQRGCKVTWLCSGSVHARLIATDGAEPTEGEVVAPDTDDLGARTRAIVEQIREISPDVILCQGVGDRIDFNAIRYLPDSIPKILILHGSTLAVYRCARAVRDYVNATVAISPRIEEDLCSTYEFQKDTVKLIPHGIDTAAFSALPLRESNTGPLRILSHGRIDKSQKGVLWLPEILVEVARHSEEWSCTVSGDGPDLEELKRRIDRNGMSSRVQFAGWTAAEKVPELMRQHDIFLFPSQWEGYPIALIEAMAAGCAPVASRLPGITDWIIQDGVNGLLFPIGDVRQAAQHLLVLLSDRRKLDELRQRAHEAVSGYSLDWMADQYYRLLCEVRSDPRPTRPAESLDDCALAEGLRPGWWYGLPEPVKSRLRLVRERLRSSVKVP